MNGDTWGISGPDFLLGYALLAAVVLVAAITWRRQHTAGPAEPGTLTVTQLALLNGGRKLALYSSIAALRAAGVIDSTKGQLRIIESPPASASPLDRAVHEAAIENVYQRALGDVPAVGAILDRVESDLVGSGLLLTREKRAFIRRGALAMVGVLAVGVARVVSGTQAGKPVGYLVLMLLGVGVLCVGLSVVDQKSRAARKLLDTYRRDSRHLAPSRRPAWSTYGPSGAALGVGLFGAGALWAADPAFAEAAAIQRIQPAAGGDGGGGGGCGGGGCGGGCGG